MKLLENLKYSKSHEWVEELEDGAVRIGITDFAQSELGDLVFVNLPEVGDEVICGESFADVESVKAVSDVFCPVSGTVRAVNEELLDAPERINEDAYDAWFVEVENITENAPATAADAVGEWEFVYINDHSEYGDGTSWDYFTMASDDEGIDIDLAIRESGDGYALDFRCDRYESSIKMYGATLTYKEEAAYEKSANDKWCFEVELLDMRIDFE